MHNELLGSPMRKLLTRDTAVPTLYLVPEEKAIGSAATLARSEDLIKNINFLHFEFMMYLSKELFLYLS